MVHNSTTGYHSCAEHVIFSDVINKLLINSLSSWHSCSSWPGPGFRQRASLNPRGTMTSLGSFWASVPPSFMELISSSCTSSALTVLQFPPKLALDCWKFSEQRSRSKLQPCTHCRFTIWPEGRRGTGVIAEASANGPRRKPQPIKAPAHALSHCPVSTLLCCSQGAPCRAAAWITALPFDVVQSAAEFTRGKTLSCFHGDRNGKDAVTQGGRLNRGRTRPWGSPLRPDKTLRGRVNSPTS